MAKFSCDKVIKAIIGRLQDMDGDDLAQAYQHISGHEAKCTGWEDDEGGHPQLMIDIAPTDDSLDAEIP